MSRSPGVLMHASPCVRGKAWKTGLWARPVSADRSTFSPSTRFGLRRRRLAHRRRGAYHANAAGGQVVFDALVCRAVLGTGCAADRRCLAARARRRGGDALLGGVEAVDRVAGPSPRCATSAGNRPEKRAIRRMLEAARVRCPDVRAFLPMQALACERTPGERELSA